MLLILLLGFLMIGLSVFLTYKEWMAFYTAFKTAPSLTKFRHLPKLIPVMADIVLAVFLSSFLGFGGGVVGGVTGLFGANLMSCLIYYHTHVKKKVP